MSGHLYKLINDESTPFLAIERLLNSESITDSKIAEYLALRKDTPQYILEWISMTVTDSRCQRAVFADRILSLKASKKIYKQYVWLVLYIQTNSFISWTVRTINVIS